MSSIMKTIKKVQHFVNLMFELSIIPAKNKPTRVTSYTDTAIDNIITSSIFDNNFESATIKTDVSDHFTTIFTINLKTTSFPINHVNQFIYERDFEKNPLNLFKQILFEISWDSSKNISF